MNFKYAFILFLTFCFNCLTQTGFSNSVVPKELAEQWFDAAKNNKLDIIKSLIGKINVNIQDSNGTTAIMHAICHKNSMGIVEFLLQVSSINLNIRDANRNTALIWAAATSQENIVRKILWKNFTPDIIDGFDLGADTRNAQDIQGMTALMWATVNTNENIIQALLTERADINIKNKLGYTATGLAVQKGHPDIIRQFWFHAIENGNLECIKELIGHIDANIQNLMGDTGLKIACWYGHLHIVETLLQVPGIDVNQQNIMGETPLSVAVLQGFVRPMERIVKLLLQSPDIIINARNNAGKTALVLAGKPQVSPIAKLIQDRIAELSNKAFDAMAVFTKTTSKAEQQKNLEKIKSIVGQIGVDNIADKTGNTLVDKAFATNKPDIILFLLQAAENPKELLVRFPFEAIQPSSAIFKLCMDIAYANIPGKTANGQVKQSKRKLELCQNCAFCSQDRCVDKCSRCRKVYYCSPECQKKHWKTHKDLCKKS